MIYVILTILKILGIIILILLGVILFILLVILIVPVRCRITGYYKDESKDIYIRLDLSWLFHLALYRLVYKGEIQENNLKILGIKAYPRSGNSGQKKKKAGKSKNKNIKDENPKENLDIDKEKSSLTDYAEGQIEGIEADCQNIVPDEAERNEKSAEKGFFDKLINRINKIVNKIRLFFIGLRDKIENKYKNIKYKASGFVKKATDIRSFIQDSENVEAVKSVLIGIKKLLVHMRPRKMRITGVLGFDDPAVTGQFFGILGMLYPYYGRNTNITASFDKKIIDVEFEVKGRLILMYAVFIVGRFLGNKRIRKWVFRK